MVPDHTLDSETEAAVRRAVRTELRAQTRAFAQVAGGVLFALLVLPMGVALVSPSLFAAGVSPVLFAAGLVGLVLALVAYGWRLPPFR